MIALLAAAALANAPPLAPLLERIRLSVPDARQISDLQVCPPSTVSPDGQQFLMMLALDRPRVPRSYYLAIWTGGRFARLDDMAQMGVPRYGLRPEVLEQRLAGCRWVAPAELEAAWDQVPQ